MDIIRRTMIDAISAREAMVEAFTYQVVLLAIVHT